MKEEIIKGQCSGICENYVKLLRMRGFSVRSVDLSGSSKRVLT